MRIIWRVSHPDNGYAQLQFDDGHFTLLVYDGAEGADYVVDDADLRDLAFAIYEEIG